MKKNLHYKQLAWDLNSTAGEKCLPNLTLTSELAPGWRFKVTRENGITKLITSYSKQGRNVVIHTQGESLFQCLTLAAVRYAKASPKLRENLVSCTCRDRGCSVCGGEGYLLESSSVREREVLVLSYMPRTEAFKLMRSQLTAGLM